MGELIEDLMKTKVLPPVYRCIQDFLTKVCMLFSFFIHSFLGVHHSLFFIDVFGIFSFQVEADRTRPNTKPKIHTGIDLIFADVPENLRVPNISEHTAPQRGSVFARPPRKMAKGNFDLLCA